MSVGLGNKIKLHQRGDTIVEVLIAITIVSLILGGAYVTSHNSLDATLDAQEHLNALQLTQAQIELLRTSAMTGGTGPMSVFSMPIPFCINSSDQIQTTVSACTVNGIGTASPNGNGPVMYYERFIASTPGSNGSYTFTAETSWPGVLNKTDEVQLIYRVYE
jgi:prepilin-type N-terminal cleavage/methylation domain-containing protein